VPLVGSILRELSGITATEAQFVVLLLRGMTLSESADELSPAETENQALDVGTKEEGESTQRGLAANGSENSL
jgi:hypothetical protein